MSFLKKVFDINAGIFKSLHDRAEKNFDHARADIDFIQYSPDPVAGIGATIDLLFNPKHYLGLAEFGLSLPFKAADSAASLAAKIAHRPASKGILQLAFNATTRGINALEKRIDRNIKKSHEVNFIRENLVIAFVGDAELALRASLIPVRAATKGLARTTGHPLNASLKSDTRYFS